MLWHNKKVIPGFMITSWVIQFFLCLFLGVMVFSLFVRWQKKMKRMHAHINQLLSIPIAIDALKRDVQATDSLNIQVQHRGINLYIPQEHKRVHWLYDQNKLMRKQQAYSTNQHMWKKSVSNLVVDHVKLCSFSSMKTLNLSSFGINIQISSQQNISKKHYIIALRNGKII